MGTVVFIAGLLLVVLVIGLLIAIPNDIRSRDPFDRTGAVVVIVLLSLALPVVFLLVIEAKIVPLDVASEAVWEYGLNEPKIRQSDIPDRLRDGVEARDLKYGWPVLAAFGIALVVIALLALRGMYAAYVRSLSKEAANRSRAPDYCFTAYRGPSARSNRESGDFCHPQLLGKFKGRTAEQLLLEIFEHGPHGALRHLVTASYASPPDDHVPAVQPHDDNEWYTESGYFLGWNYTRCRVWFGRVDQTRPLPRQKSQRRRRVTKTFR